MRNPPHRKVGGEALRRKIGILLSLLVLIILYSEPVLATEERMSLTDREILEQLHVLDVRIARLEEGQKNLLARIDGLDKRIDGLINIVLGGFAVVFAGIFSLIGFVIWDRRTAISPVARKARELEEREDLTLKVLKEYSIKRAKDG